jgi:DNA-binding NarL/FixJ family response regulator
MLGTHMADHRFIIVDDHPLFRGALGQALSAAFANAEVLEAGSLDELTDRLAMAGEIDIGVLWGPMAGYFARQANPPASQRNETTTTAKRIASPTNSLVLFPRRSGSLATKSNVNQRCGVVKK